MEAVFCRTMRFVLRQHDVRIQEDLLSFRLRNGMFSGTFPLVARIPVESLDYLEVDHRCILQQYTHSPQRPKRKGRPEAAYPCSWVR